MPPTKSHVQAPAVNELFNESYRMMDLVSTLLPYQSFKQRASAIAVLIDALHHDYAIQMQMEVDGS